MGTPAAPSPDLYRDIIESTQQYALYLLDPAGLIRTWNPGGARIFGYTNAEVIGQSAALLYRPQDRDAAVPEAEMQCAKTSGSASDHRWMQRKDGSEFWAEGSIACVRNASGEITGYACILKDASERRKLEQALERSTDELQRFAFTVSHDLQEPLRNVGNYAELLARRYKGRLDADADEFIRYMTEGVARMGQLLRDILAYSQAGREDRTKPEATESANILQWALMHVDGLVKQTGAVITYDSLPSVHVDQTQLATVLQHLLGNSIKFRSPEQPRIHISAQPANDGLWEFSVRDNGIGIDPEHAERVFGVFKRLHGRDVPGTGIGLAICRKIIDAHGGRIWLESEPGRGTTVKFTLPAA